jgi:hypothetical protein
VSAPHTLLRSVALAAALLLLAAVPVASAAKKPVTTTKATTTKAGTTTSETAKAATGPTGKSCWRALVQDWYSDGRIDKTYEVHCYRDALKHLPPDVKAYSDAYDVISRALSSATRGKATVNPNALIEPPSDQTTKTTKTTTGGVVPPGGNDGGGPSATPLGNLPGDRGAGGVPVPLIVLGALALLLVAAGAAGLLVRRMQARRGGPGAAA